MPASQFTHTDTSRADGFYVRFERIEAPDPHDNPKSKLFQDKRYRKADQKRLNAWRAGAWRYVGIRAQATCLIVRNRVGTTYTLLSPGLWGVESDSGEAYLASIYVDEIATLKADLAAMTSPQFEGEA